MLLLSAEKINKSYDEKNILNDVSLYISEGEKIGIIGINGTGKSTLLKIISGTEEPDQGSISKIKGLRISALVQNPYFPEDISVLEEVLRGSSTEERETLEYEAKNILSKLGFIDFEQGVKNLSGGEKKRVAIATALTHPCDMLILDEPTNHLDNKMVLWLENFLQRFKGAVLMVTHDRYFLDRISNIIVEIDNGNLYKYPGNYSKFLELKARREEAELAAERKNKALYKKELEWISRGARARTTKSSDRIERFEKLKERDIPQADDKINIGSVYSRLGKKTIIINSISKSFGDRVIIKNFDYIIQRQARIGIIGDNGSGKTTLVKMMTGLLSPDSGSIEYGTTVKTGYFSQEYDIEEKYKNLKVIDYIKETAEYIKTADGSISASQLLEKFLFTPSLQYNTIERLSGGEQRRLFLLKVLAEAPNILLLDEPSNDLDIQTLTIFEDYLDSFDGAVIAVSHDRYFLDKVVDTIFELRDDGTLKQYTGGYSDYLLKSEQKEKNETGKKEKDIKPTFPEKSKKLKFSYKEQIEYEKIDEEISMLENKIIETENEMEKKSSDYIRLNELTVQKGELEKELSYKMERWVYLNELAEKIGSAN